MYVPTLLECIWRRKYNRDIRGLIEESFIVGAHPEERGENAEKNL